jgi:prepilin-type N-terminal cleavage/methylation domain-containing protein
MAEERMAKQKKRAGFTLMEVLVATAVLVVCLVAIAQLVPASILSNSANRNDSSAMVFAEQEMNQFVNQPLANLQYTTDTLLNMCTAITPCLLGDPAQPGVTVGSRVVVINNSPVIDFGAAPVVGYSFLYQDPNDPTGTVYDVRWAVIAQGPTGLTSKRFILGVKRGGNSFLVPVTLDTMVVR